jgi:hypothetical protein
MQRHQKIGFDQEYVTDVGKMFLGVSQHFRQSRAGIRTKTRSRDDPGPT